MNRYDYKAAFLAKINEKSGLAATWADMVVSNPVRTDGATATLTLTPTDTDLFKGKVDVTVKRLSLNNAALIYKKTLTVNVLGADLFVFKSQPKTAVEFLALLSERLGVELTTEDISVPMVPIVGSTDVSVTIKALDTSRWFTGSTVVTFVADRTSVIKFEYSLDADVIASSSQLSDVVLVDGVRLPGGGSYTIPKGNHTLEVRYFTLTSPKNMAIFKPTRLIAVRHYEAGNPTALFQNATTLTSIDEEALHLEYGSCDRFFNGCTGLTTLPNRLFSAGSIQYSINSLFANSGITSTPSTLFSNLKVRGPVLGSLFDGCGALTAVPGGLFKDIQIDNNITTVAGIWHSAGITSISPLVLDGLTALKTVNGLFGNCNSLVTAPNGIYDRAVNLTSESGTFNNCSKLTKTPVGLFTKCPLLKSISLTFGYCNSLETVEPDVFGNCPALTIADYLFSNGGLKSISDKVFSKMPEVLTFNSLFDKCKALTAVPGTLFSNCTKVTKMTKLFEYSGLANIPSDLFAKNVELADISSTFRMIKCGDIPTDLFVNNVKLLVTANLFSSVKTTSMPSNLFRNCLLLENISAMFFGISGSDFKITADCFPGSALKDISYAFKRSDLTEIEAGTFYKHTGITKLTEAFAETGLLAIPSNLINITGVIEDINNLFASTQAKDIYPNALYVRHTGISPMPAIGVFSNNSRLKAVHGTVSDISGIVSNVSGFLKACPVEFSVDDLLASFKFDLQKPSSGGVNATDMFASCRYLTGSGLKLAQQIFGVSTGSAIFNNAGFVNKTFFLDDYDALGSPWQSTARAINVYNWLTIDAYTLGTAVAGKNGYVPLYGTYYLDLTETLTRPPSGNVSNVAITAATTIWLNGVFAKLGLPVPPAATVSIKRINKSEDSAWSKYGLRSTVTSVTLLAFDGALETDVAAACNNPNNYLLCA